MLKMRTSPWLTCLSLSVLLACGDEDKKDPGTSLDNTIHCAANQAYDRTSNQCVELPACAPKLLQVNLKKGPKSPDGWSAWTPDVSQPTADLRAVWGAGDSDAWMVGSGGAILAWQGLAWVPQPSGTTADLNAVWGVNPCLAWAVGQSGTLIQWDGNTWTSQTSGSSNALHGVWGSDAYDVWSVGERGSLLHFDGKTWAAETSGTSKDLLAIWGSDRNNVWAVGQDGLLLHFDGASWTEWSSGTSQTLLSIWGADPEHVWAVGRNGTILKFDGVKWISESIGTVPDLFSIHGFDATKIWAVGGGGVVIEWNEHGHGWGGHGFGSPDLLGTWGASVPKRWAVGRSGTIAAFRGDFQYPETGPTFGPSYLDGRAVFGTSASNVWVTGKRGLVLSWDGTSWKQERSGTGLPLLGVWGSDSNNAWAVGSEFDGSYSSGFFRWNGSVWSPVPGGEDTFLGGIWGSDPNQIWAAASRMLKWDGSVWMKDPGVAPSWPTGIFGLDAKNVWTMGSISTGPVPPIPTQTALIWNWNGSKWSQAYSRSWLAQGSLNGLWASDPTNVWVVGAMSDQGGPPTYIWKLSGANLNPVASPATKELRGISGSDANNIFAVGGAGTLLRGNGTAFSPQNISGYASDLYAVWAADAVNVWAVGDGVILQHE